MINDKDNIRLQEAFELQKADFNKEAVFILKDLAEKYPTNKKIVSLLGLALAKMEARTAAIPYLEKAIKLAPKNELLHLSLYISYISQEDYENAFVTLFSYLTKYPADLFKDTLEELLEGLLDGYGTSHKDEIIFYAKRNGIPVPEKLRNE